MAKIRVHDLAKEIGRTNRDVIDYLTERGYDVISAVNVVPENEIAGIRAKFGGAQKPADEAAVTAASEPAKPHETQRENDPESKNSEEKPKKKGGFVRVFRSENATRQLQRRPQKRSAQAPETARRQEEAKPAADRKPEAEETTVRNAEPQAAPSDILKKQTPETAEKPQVKETPAAAVQPAEKPSAAPDQTAAAVKAEKEAAPAKAAAETPEVPKAPVKEQPVQEAPAAVETPAAKTEAAPQVKAEAAASESGKPAEEKSTEPKAGEAKAPQADTGFRNGRVLRNVGPLNRPISTGRNSSIRDTSRSGGQNRRQGDAAQGGSRDRQGGYRDRNGAQGQNRSDRGPARDRGSFQGDRNRTSAQGGGFRDRNSRGGAADRAMGGRTAPGGMRGPAAAGGRPAPGGAPAARGGRSSAPAGRNDADGSLARKTTRDFRKDGKERERNREERRENGREMGSGRPNQQKRQFNRVPKALQHKQPAGGQEKKEDNVTEIRVPDKITIRELAEKMKLAPTVLIKELFMKGEMVTVNHELPYDKAEAIAMEHNILCEHEEQEDVIGELLKEEAESESDMVTRPPVICVMGHVDHGKTSLLDAIRNTHVTDREAGGITQHIGAYMVSVGGQKLTFLDTPGHEAFTAMRMRGANATDIAVLVVAADDGVMPQTVEAINHAKAAEVEIIVAVNKIDKPGANIDRVKQELSEYGLVAEDWGGETVFCPVSAKTHEGLDNLLEMIVLTSEMLELKANPNRKARGIVLEAKLDKGRGPVASILIQKGTLKQGDFIACGAASGKVRAMTDEHGKRLHKATPSMPVEIIGLSAVPEAGEVLVALDSDKEAKEFAAVFVTEGKKNLIEETRTQMTLDDLYNQIKEGNLKELPIVVKADVQGSVEAVSQSLLKLSNEEVIVKVIHGGVGAINESDVSLAAASNAIIIGFNVRPDNTAKTVADNQKVDIHLYSVIYEAIEDVERALNGMRAAVFEEKIQGHAEIRQVFKASGVGNIAGAYIRDGIFQRASKVRVFRGKDKLYEGQLASLKRFKDDVKEVREGFECGFVFDGWGDFQVEDTVEAYTMVEVPRT